MNTTQRSFTNRINSFKIIQILILILMICSFWGLRAQDYILSSGFYGSSTTDYTRDYLVYGNSLYIVGVINSDDFPTTDGSIANPASTNISDYFFMKYDATTMQLQEARIFSGEGNDEPYKIVQDGSHLYIFGLSNGPGMPATTGAGYKSGNDLHVLKLDLDGNIVDGAYVGGSYSEIYNDVEVDNGKAHLLITTWSFDIPVTNNSTIHGGSDIVYFQIDLASMIPSFVTYIGGNNAEENSKFFIEGTTAYLGFESKSNNLPVTDGSAYSGFTGSDLIVSTIDINTNTITKMTYLGGSGNDELVDINVAGGQIFVQGKTKSTDFTVTNGSYYQPGHNDYNVIFAHYDSSFALQTSAYVFAGDAISPNLEYHNGYIYLTGRDTTNRENVLKLDVTGNVLWNYSGISGVSPINQTDLHINNDVINISTIVRDLSSIATNGSYKKGFSEFYFSRLTLDGHLKFAGYYGGSSIDRNLGSTINKDWLQVDGSKVWLVGVSTLCFATTNGSSSYGANISSMLIETCASNFEGDSSQLVPTQTVCSNSFVEEIKVDPYLVPGTDLPQLEVCGTTVIQQDIHASYQWQSALGSSGPWTDITGANNQNYSPSPLLVTTYFRRLAKQHACCGGQLLQTSEIHCVIVGPDNAPAVDAGGIFNTCPGTSITMVSTVAGGLPPYQYQWTAGNSSTILSTSPNLTTTPTSAGAFVYTLIVTDAAGCRQIDQSIVNAYSANAGNDISFCENLPGPEIGSLAVPGLPGVIYNWTPPTGLSCTNCPNPTATPATTTQYTLTLTIPVSGGGTCTTTDQITVTPVLGPSVPNFAGPDKVICFGTSVQVGTAAESGFSYAWAPGSYLADNLTTPTTFDHGNYDFQQPNPITYYLTAEKEGCTWYDQAEVAVIKAKAYLGNLDPACGPRYVGEGDLTPNINETWQWTQLSGDGSFTGPTNIPVTTVSASTNSTSRYQLAVTYNGTTCTSIATTPPCGNGGGCDVEIIVQGGIGCPNTADYEEVCLNAIVVLGPPGLYAASWSPQVGLDTFFGPVVCLTDTVFRTYTVTMVNVLDSTIVCTETIDVNDPAWSKPTFMAQDVFTCSNQPIKIGGPNVSGYSYEWSPQDDLDNHLISNPLATVASSSFFTVKVTDIQSGCIVVDTATVSISNPYAIGGPDQLICNAGVFTLGYPPIPNIGYSWTPAGANWQNGTDQYSAQPEVLVAVNTTFVLTTTDSISGCVDIDTVQIDVGQPVTPFTLPDISYCNLQSALILGADIPIGLGISYSWSPKFNLFKPFERETTLFPPPPNGGVYTVIVTNSSGCSYQTTQTVVPSILPPIAGGTQSICIGETVQIGSSSNPTGSGISYSWSPTSGLSNPTSPNPTLTALAVGTFTYTLTVNNNGCSNSSTVNVSVHDFSVSIAPKTICAGACVNIGVQAVPGATYSWSPSTGLDDPTIANPLACVSANTVYTLVATGPTGCETIVQVPVYLNPSPAPQVNIPVSTFCMGTTGNTINPTVSPPGSYTYNWTPNNGTLIYPNSPTPEVVLSSLGSTNYQVTITNTISGCATLATADVSVLNCDPNTLCLNADICLEISVEPNHPLSTMDCDGDGVTNADECRDMTDPLDPCDYLDLSITLPVIADQSGCPPPCTDLTPIVKILPGNISGNSLVQVSVKISEVNDVDTDGSVISVRIPSDPRLVFVWDIGLTFVALTTVQNADWNYLGDNGTFHSWTYNGPGLIIDGQTSSAFGFYSYYDPQGTDGQTTITATVVPFSGGECHLINNSDSERLVYFQ